MWQTIDTAPKPDAGDIGPRVLIYDPSLSPGGFVAVAWRIKARWFVESEIPDGASPEPSHWMPLPEAPPVDWKPKTGVMR